MPVLAQMPFSAELRHLVEWRAWDLKAYQIRSGMAGIVVPIIEGEQPPGYAEAAAMQIAALADDPSAADVVRDLRRVLKPKTVEIIHADRDIALSSTNLPQAFSAAEAMIAARRKDYAKCAALARMPSENILIDPPTVVIDALLDEGDWRGAAEIARDQDPRKQKLVEGFDDHRPQEYVTLYTHLALRAAWRGDDAAAAAFLARAKNVARAELPEDEGGSDDAFFSHEMLLAGLAEGRLPRKYIYVFVDAFRSAY
jgi:hypothetical protein